MGIFCFVSWNHNRAQRIAPLLEIIRFLTACLIIAVLWQIEWRKYITPNHKPKIAVLCDQSESMDTLDAYFPEKNENSIDQVMDNKLTTRFEWITKTITSDVWKSFTDVAKYDWDISYFSQKKDGEMGGTDISAPLEDLYSQSKHLEAVILFSDGDNNLGNSPLQIAQLFKQKDIPIHTLCIGKESYLPDLELTNISSPNYGIIGENVQISFSVRSSLPYQVNTMIELRDAEDNVVTKALAIAPQQELNDTLLWDLREEGSIDLNLSIPVLSDEVNSENNAKTFSIKGKISKTKVLIIETLPRWEYRFLRNALSRDPSVELSCLLMHPDLGAGDGAEYISEFPKNIEQLSAYDVIILGDVGLGEKELSREQCELINELVHSQASGLVFIPGRQGKLFSLSNTKLSNLLPVRLDAQRAQGFYESYPTSLILSDEGKKSLLTLLGDSEDENSDIWRQLPGFYWHAPVLRAKAGSNVLAVHGSRTNSYGAIPLIITQSAGSGKVLFMGIDSAWRWRRGVEDQYHYRYWGQVVRWMAYQRNIAPGEKIRLFIHPEKPKTNTNIFLKAQAIDTNLSPLNEQSIDVDIISPQGISQRISLKKNNSAWGSYEGSFSVTTPGVWQVHAISSILTEFPNKTQIYVGENHLEKIGEPARPQLLKAISEISGGHMTSANDLPRLLQAIQDQPTRRALEQRISVGSHWISLSTILALLTILWIGRKWNQMI